MTDSFQTDRMITRNSAKGLVAELVERGCITKSRVAEAMTKVDRAKYCPSKAPYDDSPAPIGYNATISAPHMHAMALEAVEEKLVDGAKVLDVGSGSGYLTACLAHMVGPSGKVYGLEHIKQLVEQSIANIKNDCANLVETERVVIMQADGRDGLEEHAPFDVIHVGACAGDLPKGLLAQLKVGGRMVLPVVEGVDQVFKCIEKLPNDNIEVKRLALVRYVPLTTAKAQLEDR